MASPPPDSHIVLSFGQERIWFLEQLEPESGAYNRPCHVRLEGPLDLDALRTALTALVARHDTLRSRFVDRSGVPAVETDDAGPVDLRVTSLEHLPADQRPAEAARLAGAQARRLFNLAEGPVFRADVLRLGPTRHLLLITVHHIVFDDWSQGILHRELGALYSAAVSDSPPPLDPLQVRYRDFAHWEREPLAQRSGTDHESYWQDQLISAPFVLDLPTAGPRPATQTYRGGHYDFRLPASITRQLHTLTKNRGITPFMSLLAGFSAVLHRYTGAASVLVGTPVFGRTRTEWEPLIGLFINTLVMRADFGPTVSYEELVGRVQQTVLKGLSHQDIPFERLLTLLDVPRDPSRSPLFQAFFNYRNVPRPTLTFAGLDAAPYPMPLDVARFDLTLEFERHGPDDLRGRLIYNADLWDLAMTERMAGHLVSLLTAALEAPRRSLDRLPMLTDGERQQRRALNTTSADATADRCIHVQFSECAARWPDRIAVAATDATLTYAELDTQTSALARKLRARGVGPEAVVGVCVERSSALVVALLAILKAGAAYLPLDPDYPPARLALMLEDSGAALVISDPSARTRVPPSAPEVLVSDGSDVTTPPPDHADVGDPVELDTLAYVIYTSGSTGRPKGVEILHRSVANLFAGMDQHLRLSGDDRWLAVTSPSFDIHTLELLFPLTRGSRVIVATETEVRDGRRLVDLMQRSGATFLQATPSTWRLLVQEDWRSPPVTALSGGETLPRPLANELLRRVGRLYNVYGPTETTVWSTLAEVTPNAEGPVSIGRPLRNTQVRVLDSHRQDVPVGVIGELYIGGLGLARGYRHQPELTSERFIEHSADGGSQRLYRTGDLAKWQDDGALALVGRGDAQVKVRGFRIELEEIEAVLDTHPDVQKSVVIVKDVDVGDQRLVAYVLPTSHENSTDQDGDAQVSDWGKVWDNTFVRAEAVTDLTLNTAGVTSSYTQRPIPAEETRDWVEHAAARIDALDTRRVLEVGCGLGRILFRVAPGSDEYWGLDPSPAALDYVSRNRDQLVGPGPSIRLRRQTADDWQGIPDGHFTLVVFNGVVMYFPSARYLKGAVEAALRATAPGGSIFLGDLRSLPLLEAFQLSVVLAGAEPDLPITELWARLGQRLVDEEELLVDPRLFAALRRHYPRIGSVRLRLKRGLHQNELTRFRYDVVLGLDRQTDTSPAETAWSCWSWERRPGLDLIEGALQAGSLPSLQISDVPNARVLPEIDLLGQRDTLGAVSCATVSARLEQQRAALPDPEIFWQIGKRAGYEVDVTWSSTSKGPGYVDVLFHKGTPPAAEQDRPVSEPAVDSAALDWSLFTNDPMTRPRDRALNQALQVHVNDQLPAYMHPSQYVVVDSLPRTPNGKIDRRALPDPAPLRTESRGSSTQPHTALEHTLLEIWKEILGRDDIGIDDDFVELGGHSLLVMQGISRIEHQLGVSLSVRDFLFKTVSELASVCEDKLAATR